MAFTAKVKGTDSLFQAVSEFSAEGEVEHHATELRPNQSYRGHLWLDAKKSRDSNNEDYAYSKREDATFTAEQLDVFHFDADRLRLRPSRQ